MENNEVAKRAVDPYAVFKEWYNARERSGINNYNAVALSTSGQNGNVSSRMVLLKNYDERGFVFFSNYESRKGKQLDENPNASLLFYWPEYGRQVRIEGNVKKISDSNRMNILIQGFTDIRLMQ